MSSATLRTLIPILPERRADSSKSRRGQKGTCSPASRGLRLMNWSTVQADATGVRKDMGATLWRQSYAPWCGAGGRASCSRRRTAGSLSLSNVRHHWRARRSRVRERTRQHPQLRMAATARSRAQRERGDSDPVRMRTCFGSTTALTTPSAMSVLSEHVQGSNCRPDTRSRRPAGTAMRLKRSHSPPGKSMCRTIASGRTQRNE